MRRKFVRSSKTEKDQGGSWGTSSNTMTINLVAGSVELTEGKAKVRRRFSGVIVVGDDMATIRRNFRYSRAFLGRDNVKERKRIEEKEAAGLVRIINIEVEKKLGQTNY